VQETDFNGRSLRYAHDAGGQLVRRTNGAGETTDFVRDMLGRLVERHSGGVVTRFAYDHMGRLVRAVDPQVDLLFQRDAVGRIVAETCNGHTLHAAYDPSGRRTRSRTPAGVEAAWTFDAAGRLSGLNTAGQTLGFTHDAAGREVRRHIGSGAILDQQYDPDHHLTAQTLWGAPRPAAIKTVAGEPAPDSASRPRLLQHRAYR
jgi:YD repeat-containing protein